MTNYQLWGDELRKQRKAAGLTQGQLIDQLSHLIGELSDAEKLALEAIDIYQEAATYFGGILDSPTLSRLEKGTRTVAQRPRALAFVWGFKKLGVLQTIEQANRFLEIGNHGNMTTTESNAIFGISSGNGGADAVTRGVQFNDARFTGVRFADTVGGRLEAKNTVASSGETVGASTDVELSNAELEIVVPGKGVPERGAPERGAPERGVQERGVQERVAPVHDDTLSSGPLTSDQSYTGGEAATKESSRYVGLIVAVALLAAATAIGFAFYQLMGTDEGSGRVDSSEVNPETVEDNAAAQTSAGSGELGAGGSGTGQSNIGEPLDTSTNTSPSASSASDSKEQTSPVSERTTETLLPASSTTQLGSFGGDQVVENLHLLDQNGRDDDWLSYVKFVPTDKPYRGYRSYFLPKYIEPSTVTGLRLETNYRGPGEESQLWTWSLYNWSSQSWVSIGNNSDAPWWGEWTRLTFAPLGAIADYIHPATLEMQVQSVANNTIDTMDLDYEALIVEFPKSMAGSKMRTSATISENILGFEINPKLRKSENVPRVTIQNSQLLFDMPINSRK